MVGYLKDLFTGSGLDVNVGLVQTAYSNGNSTKYVTEKLVSIKNVCILFFVYNFFIIILLVYIF